MQCLLEVDHSSGHLKSKPDALSITGMNVYYGGVQRKLRDSVMIEGCLGENPPEINGIRLQIGSIQKMQFQPGDRSPFNFPEAIDYIGKPKGMYQILYERGLYKVGMIKGYSDAELHEKLLNNKEVKDETLQAQLVLSGSPDFKHEKSALQEIFESRGHLLITSPKCHPELAGLGIEYCLGLSKKHFRRDINDGVQKNLQKNIILSVSEKSIPLQAKWRFERRTRAYREVYQKIKKEGKIHMEDLTFEDIEKMLKVQKTHRNIFDLERRYLQAISSASTQNA